MACALRASSNTGRYDCIHTTKLDNVSAITIHSWLIGLGGGASGRSGHSGGDFSTKFGYGKLNQGCQSAAASNQVLRTTPALSIAKWSIWPSRVARGDTGAPAAIGVSLWIWNQGCQPGVASHQIDQTTPARSAAKRSIWPSRGTRAVTVAFGRPYPTKFCEFNPLANHWLCESKIEAVIRIPSKRSPKAPVLRKSTP